MTIDNVKYTKLIYYAPYILNNLIVIVILGLGGLGCSSLGKNPNSQPALIRSGSSQLDIFVNDKFIGKTPLYIGLERRRSGHLLKIKHKGTLLYSQKIISKYRWQNSFFNNFVFLTLAPYAWAWDLGSGSAWAYQQDYFFQSNSDVKESHSDKVPSGNIESENQSKINSQVKSMKIVIAPPKWTDENEDEKLPQKLGLYWEAWARKEFPNATVMSFKETLSIFSDQSYDFDRGRRLWGNTDRKKSANLAKARYAASVGTEHKFSYDAQKGAILAATGATHIFESSLILKGEKVKLKGLLENAYTGTVLLRKDVTLKLSKFETKGGGLSKQWRDWVSFFPNAITVDSATYRPKINIDKTDFYGRRLTGDGFWSEAINYLGALGVSKLKGPIHRHRWKFDFEFVPTATLSFGKISYDVVPELAGLEFDRWNIGLGFGPEWGIGSRFGRFYAKLLPSLTWTQIDWISGGKAMTDSGSKVESLFELGYSFFMTQRLALRIFSRAVNENQKVWAAVFDSQSSTLKERVKSVGYEYFGISLGLYFPDFS